MKPLTKKLFLVIFAKWFLQILQTLFLNNIVLIVHMNLLLDQISGLDLKGLMNEPLHMKYQ